MIVGRIAVAAIATLLAVDVMIAHFMPPLPRLSENFSASYLRRIMKTGQLSGSVVVLGDSVFWGYGLSADHVAAALLRHDGIPTINLSYEGGSIANTYALLRMLQSAGVRPRSIVFNVNLKEFNTADRAYNVLHPAVATLAWDELSSADRRVLQAPPAATFESRADEALSRVWRLYGERSELREVIFGSVDAATGLDAMIATASGRAARDAFAHRATPDRFLGTYDLAPLRDGNVEVRFLHEIGGLLRSWGVPALAVLTPANPELLRDIIDSPEYRAQREFVRGALPPPIRVVDYHGRFAASEFIDNDHLTAIGNTRLARLLERDIPR